MANLNESVITPVSMQYSYRALAQLKREQLNEIALGLSVLNAVELSTKQKVIDAILLEQNGVDRNEDREITEQNKNFVRLYALDFEYLGNGTRAYAEAYGLDLDERGAYNTASAGASRLLSDSKVLEYLETIRSATPLTDEMVDEVTHFWIVQRTYPMASLAAIREYNKVRSRGEANRPLAPVNNSLTINFNDERGKWLANKYTEFMTNVTQEENTEDDLKGLRNAKDYA